MSRDAGLPLAAVSLFLVLTAVPGWRPAAGQQPAVRPDELRALATQVLATLDGDLQVAGLRDRVDVIRDRWGIPHIYARNVDDLFFAQGYVTAQDRLWQMEMWRRWREGRLAEIFGPAALPHDERTRLMMFRGPWDQAEWTSYHPEGERIFTAYANGVNAYIDQHADNLPVEFRLTGVRPGRWTAKTVVLRWTSLAFPSSRGHALDEIQLALDVARDGRETANRRAAPDPWDDLVIPDGLDVKNIPPEIVGAMRRGDGDPFVSGALPDLEIVEPYRRLVARVAVPRAQELPEEGSNNWVVSGARSATGVPVLANDPHRRIEMPALRYFVHLNAPGWNVSGGGEPPFAGIDAGHNERMGWGFTFAGTDMHDVFVEELHPEKPDVVKWQGAWEPLRVIREDIPVKGEAPRPVVLKFSRNGPIFFEDLPRRRAYAVRSIVHEPGTAPYKGSFQLAQATSCKEFFDRAMAWKAPSHSLICGDAEGNIALQVSALTPDRDGWNGRLPVPGDGRYRWKGFRRDLPREFNPSRGYIATANNNVHPPDYKGRPVFYHTTRGSEHSRIARLHQLLGTGRKLSIDDHRRIQLDAYSLRAAADKPLFSGWTARDLRVERARLLIEQWNAEMARGSAAAAIYVTWAELVDDKAIGRDVPPAQRQQAVEAGLAAAVEQLGRDWGQDWSDWRYGRIHRSELPHMLVPAFSLPAVERDGGFGTVNATGANFRRILDFSNLDRSIGTSAPGQSAQPGSPYYDNLVPHWANGDFFPLVFSREAVDKNAAHRLRLVPAAGTASR
jgi:penicillin amidase